MEVTEIKQGYYEFGNKGACWENKVHLAKTADSATLCGTPMLSTNWAAIWGLETVGCPKCLEEYNSCDLSKPYEKIVTKVNNLSRRIEQHLKRIQGGDIYHHTETESILRIDLVIKDSEEIKLQLEELAEPMSGDEYVAIRSKRNALRDEYQQRVLSYSAASQVLSKIRQYDRMLSRFEKHNPAGDLGEMTMVNKVTLEQFIDTLAPDVQDLTRFKRVPQLDTYTIDGVDGEEFVKAEVVIGRIFTHHAELFKTFTDRHKPKQAYESQLKKVDYARV